METNNYSTEDLVLWLDREMPKYLRLNGGEEYYVPIIYKHEWTGHKNSWIAMLAKEGSKYFNPANCILCVEGSDFASTIQKFRDEFNRFATIGVFVGKEYHPEKLPEDKKGLRYAYDITSCKINTKFA